MNEVELIKEAEEWVSENGFGSDCNNLNSVDANREMVNAYLAGAKSREKRIIELEKENAELKKRNGELVGQKASLERWLDEAKELIEDMYYQIPASHSDYYKDVMDRAKQLLKE